MRNPKSLPQIVTPLPEQSNARWLARHRFDKAEIAKVPDLFVESRVSVIGEIFVVRHGWWYTPILRATYEVSKALSNDDVLAESIEPNFPPGTIVRDTRIEKMYRVGGDVQMVEQIIDLAQQELDKSNSKGS